MELSGLFRARESDPGTHFIGCCVEPIGRGG